jgi:hypothetical protein
LYGYVPDSLTSQENWKKKGKNNISNK